MASFRGKVKPSLHSADITCLDSREGAVDVDALTDPEPYTVTIRTDRSAQELAQSLILKTVYDIH